jgi:adenosylcobinamide amidohydrolase
MGCLNISVIGLAYDTELVIEPKNSFPELELTNKNTSAEISLTSDSGTTAITAENCNNISISLQNKNTGGTLDIVLICKVGLDEFAYLQVLEGNVILIDGSYVKVLRG